MSSWRMPFLVVLFHPAVCVAEETRVVDQVSPDITVLKSFPTDHRVAVKGGEPAQLELDLAACELRSERGGGAVDLDCSGQLAALLAEKAPAVAAPLVLPDLVTAARTPSGGLQSQHHCTIQEIQTITRTKALPDALGIGFWFNGQLTFVPTSELVEVGSARLRTGDSATIHRFLAPIFCWKGSVSNTVRETYLFKPFLLFQDEEGTSFRSWDLARSNYRLQFASVKGFDRTQELVSY